jgi:hypothetical protein
MTLQEGSVGIARHDLDLGTADFDSDMTHSVWLNSSERAAQKRLRFRPRVEGLHRNAPD